MKNKILSVRSLLILLLILSGVSCQKLKEEPAGISTPDTFYKTTAQCEAAFAGSMNALFSTWNGYQNGYLFPDGQFENASLDLGIGSFNEVWTLHYKAIADINAVLKAVKGGSLDGNGDDVIAGIVAQ